MASDNIFSGLKVLDLASFIAGPAAATILSDFGADVIKVEPPGIGDPYRLVYKMPPHPVSSDNYAWHLDNRNKRGIAVDLKSPGAKEIVQRLVKSVDVVVINFPTPVRKRLGLMYEDLAPLNPRLIYADVTGFGDNGPDASLPGFDATAYWARSGLLALTRDAGAPPTLPASGSGDHASAVGLYAAIVTALYRREQTGKGSHVTTSLVAEGAWSISIYIQAALCQAKFYPLHDRMNPPNGFINVYQTSDDHWFVLMMQPKDWPALAKALGRPDLLTDSRFADPKGLVVNVGELVKILDQTFGAQPMAHWQSALDEARITYGPVQHPSESGTDPQLLTNDIVVPLEGAGPTLKHTVSSPLKIHGVTKVPAKRAPEIGEHNEEVLKELGFTTDDIASLRASGTIPHISILESAATGGGR